MRIILRVCRASWHPMWPNCEWTLKKSYFLGGIWNNGAHNLSRGFFQAYRMPIFLVFCFTLSFIQKAIGYSHARVQSHSHSHSKNIKSVLLIEWNQLVGGLLTYLLWLQSHQEILWCVRIDFLIKDILVEFLYNVCIRCFICHYVSNCSLELLLCWFFRMTLKASDL